MTQSPKDTPSMPTGSGDEEKSIVSKNFSIVGDLTCQDDLHIDGSVEGNIHCQQLIVSEGGSIKGDIRADTIDMHGTLTGAIDARVLTLSKTSNVVGDIVVHESLGIEPGASFDGNCKKLGGSENKAADDDAAGVSKTEFPGPQAPAPDKVSMAGAAKADTTEMPAESMSSALDKVAAELKAGIGLAVSEKAAAEPQMEPPVNAPATAGDVPDPGGATSPPDPAKLAESMADAMVKPVNNGAGAPPDKAAPSAAPPANPDTEPAAVAAPKTPATASEPVKPTAAPAKSSTDTEPDKPAAAPAKPPTSGNGASPTG